jgi:hypothetical protein
MTNYRDYEITFNPPPIPSRACDWQYTHKDYDGPEDPRIGHAESLEAAKSDIDDLVIDLEYKLAEYDEENNIKRCGDCGSQADKLVKGVGICCYLGEG